MENLILSEIDRLPLHKIVYTKLRQSILAGELKPGQKLVESELSSQMKISKTPLREALRELSQEGLLLHTTRRGIRVIDFVDKDVTDIIVLRAELEGLALRLGFTELRSKGTEKLEKIVDELGISEQNKDRLGMSEKDLEFHREIVVHSGNSRLLKSWNTFSSQMQVLLMKIDYYHFNNGYLEQFHRRLLEAIDTLEKEEAVHILKEHILLAEENIRHYLNNAVAR